MSITVQNETSIVINVTLAPRADASPSPDCNEGHARWPASLVNLLVVALAPLFGG